jgi:hypothetical protein
MLRTDASQRRDEIRVVEGATCRGIRARTMIETSRKKTHGA